MKSVPSPRTLVIPALLAGFACAPDSAEQAAREWPLSEVVAAEAPAGDTVLRDADDDTAMPGPMAEAAAHEGAAAAGGATGRGGTAGSDVAETGPSSAEIVAQRRETSEQIANALAKIPPPPPREDFEDARFARPEHVRGLYANAWASGSARRMDELFGIARTTEINAIVVDIKDATGFVSHDTRVPLAREVGATGEIRIRDLPALLDRFEAEGVYPIARIVVVKDPLMAAKRPEMAVQDTAGGVWIDSKELVWLNPYDRRVWEYHVALAREVAEMGFPEIQWDYIRFPDAPESDMARAVFTGSEGRPRVEAIRGFLAYARDELSDLPVRTTADVFGVTTSFRRDIGIGQLWETFIDVVDVALPMVYPSHYWEHSFGYDRPNAYPYEVVKEALDDALSRSARVAGAGSIRPWIQDFTLGPPLYGAPEVRAQIQASYDVGIEEWILWNPSTRYSVEALEPIEGFEDEPLIRVAGVLAPVSRRYAVIDSVAAVDIRTSSADTLDASADSVGAPAVAVDTASVPVVRIDTAGVPPVPVDTALVPSDRPAVDTLSVPVVDSIAVPDSVRPDTTGVHTVGGLR